MSDGSSAWAGRGSPIEDRGAADRDTMDRLDVVGIKRDQKCFWVKRSLVLFSSRLPGLAVESDERSESVGDSSGMLDRGEGVDSSGKGGWVVEMEGWWSDPD